ncbi:NF-kappa-B-repressing factor isoform 2 [Camelus ferus]|nr:NF-kappa-B-repressing factor isoform 2 [Camelus ferus]
MEKILQMAEGIDIGEMPSYDLMLSKPSKGQKRHLSTCDGYAGSKNGSRDRATELAVKLLQKRIEVRVVRRKFKHTIGEDLVVCQVGMPSYEFPPALKPPEELVVLAKDASGQPIFNASAKHWTNFILTENANDAIGILNNSASYNKMSVEYKYEMMPNRTWRCRVFLQDHCLAEVKSSQCQTGSSPRGSGKKKDIKDLVVYENSSNPVCTLNDTAQFNRMTVEYVYERMTGLRWKCKPTVINNLKKGAIEDVISRNEIQGRSAEEAYKQQIKEDNIGNQLLRKMGWTGGGLELTNDERKQIHQIAQKYGLKTN